MSISQLNKKTVRAGLIAFAALAVFAAVYEHFSHGVISPHMVLMPLYPLIGIALVFAFARPLRLFRMKSGWDRAAWLCGVATLTVNSLLKGIMQIYGTEHYYEAWLLIAGFALIGLSLGMQLPRIINRTRR